MQQYMRGHVRELLSNYGKIDLLWYDGAAWAAAFPGGVLPPELVGAEELNALARSLQPEIIINDRSGLPEDFYTAENYLTPAPAGRDWEMCVCTNDLWGYHPHDHNYKTRNQLVFLLVSCAVYGGNLLLNIGPRGDGSVPEPQVERMKQLGDWLAIHGESVYGVERLAQNVFNSGRVTRQGRTLYFHAFYWPGPRMRVPFLTAETLQGEPGRCRVQARCLTTGRPAGAHWDGEVLEITGLPAEPPDQADTVVAVEVG
jgi:alpha-L-fucosidase